MNARTLHVACRRLLSIRPNDQASCMRLSRCPRRAVRDSMRLCRLQIAGVTEVKGQIKLQMRTASGNAILVYRAFQLNQTKTKKTFKTLDGTIEQMDHETLETTAVSKKCADMDKLVPYLMDVQRAVLEHVVFVHQEDSLWPLSESKPLKERFDAIFAATKYTAAVGKMREIIKEKTQARAVAACWISGVRLRESA